MALAPKFAGQKFAAVNAPTLHTLELYLVSNFGELPLSSLLIDESLGLCLPILCKDVQHNPHLGHAIDQTKICFKGTDSVQTADPTMASQLHTCA